MSWTPATVTQPMYNLLARGIEQEYLPMAQHFGIATCVYNPLAGGMLTGKQQREKPQAGTRFDNNQMYLDRYWHPAYFDAVDRLAQIAASGGTVAGEPVVELAAAPHAGRLRDSGRFAAGATGAESGDVGRWPAGPGRRSKPAIRSGAICAASRRSTIARTFWASGTSAALLRRRRGQTKVRPTGAHLHVMN